MMTKKKNQQKHLEADNRLMVVTRGEKEWQEAKMGKGGQLPGDGWKLDSGGEHDAVYADVGL